MKPMPKIQVTPSGQVILTIERGLARALGYVQEVEVNGTVKKVGIEVMEQINKAGNLEVIKMPPSPAPRAVRGPGTQ